MSFDEIVSYPQLEKSFLGNSLNQWATAGLLFFALIIAFAIVQRLIVSRLEFLSTKTKTDLDDEAIKLVKSVKPPFYFVLSLFLSLQTLSFSARFEKIIGIATIALIVYQIIRSLSLLLDYVSEKWQRRESKNGNVQAIKTLIQMAKGTLWVFGVLVLLQNMGINVTSLLAGLGIGGVAIALAAQSVLADLFSSFAILFDKPFVPGDFIIVGDNMGVVEKIGIKTTRIKALQGEEIVISNQELTSSRIQNFKKMRERRVVFSFGIVYQTPASKLKQVPKIVKAVIKGIEKTKFDRAHFMEFGDSGLKFEVVYYVEDGDYNLYMDIHQKILQGINEEFEKNKIEFAYPTQTVFLEK